MTVVVEKEKRLVSLYVVTFVLVGITAVVSILGLLSPHVVYPTEELRQSFVANDVVNLLIGVPALLVAMRLTRHGRLLGLLAWPGAVLYVLYNYVAYLVARPFDLMTLVYLSLVLFSAAIMLAMLQHGEADAEKVRAQLLERVPAKGAGWVLASFGILFLLRAVVMLGGAVLNHLALSSSELGVLVADVMLSLLFLAGGALLVKRLPLGYVLGLGLLFAANLLFVGLLAFLLLQPVLMSVPFVPADFIVIVVMWLFCLLPGILFGRGVWSQEI